MARTDYRLSQRFVEKVRNVAPLPTQLPLAGIRSEPPCVACGFAGSIWEPHATHGGSDGAAPEFLLEELSVVS